MAIRHFGTVPAYRMSRSPFRDESKLLHTKLNAVILVMFSLFMVNKNVRNEFNQEHFFDTCTMYFHHLEFNKQMHNFDLLYELYY